MFSTKKSIEHCCYKQYQHYQATCYPRAFRRKSGDYVIPFAVRRSVRPSVRLPFDRPLSPPRLLKLES